MRLKALGRIKPSAAEVAANPRARSAILRVAERTGAPASPRTKAPAGGRRS
jgi:16S rRNA (cytosine1402-N4)-methyltransferase